VVRAMEKMRELVQQSSSSSSELAAAAEQMSKLSRALLESMDRFVLDEGLAESRRLASRRSSGAQERQTREEYAELAHS
jgi:hypothetical protein